MRGNRELPKAPNIEYNSTTAFTDPSERFFATSSSRRVPE